jgi:hypothetical protein
VERDLIGNEAAFAVAQGIEQRVAAGRAVAGRAQRLEHVSGVGV